PAFLQLALHRLPEHYIEQRQQQGQAKQAQCLAIPVSQLLPALQEWRCLATTLYILPQAHASPPISRRALTPCSSRPAEPISTCSPCAWSRSRSNSRPAKSLA